MSTLWPQPEDLSTLSGHQCERYGLATVSPVCVIGGNPGTGKTHTTAQIIKAVIQEHGVSQIAAACFTGKAAQRVNELLFEHNIHGIQATTIHRLLGVSRNGHDKKGWGFIHNSDNPLLKRFLFIDESSMLGIDLTASLLAALSPGTHVLFIGDFAQLPPVEHGAPLRDMIAAGLPYGELTEVWRNEGDIVTACRDVKEGRPLRPSVGIDVAAGRNLPHIEAARPAMVLGALASLLRSCPATFDPVWDVQVLCAINEKSEVSRKLLNTMLQNILNPDGEQVENMRFRMNDKVICGTNQMLPVVECPFCNCGGAEAVLWNGKANECTGCGRLWPVKEMPLDFVANGEIGRVSHLEKGLVYVAFDAPARTVRVAGVSIGDFDLAYAITTHKCVHPDTLVETLEGLLPIKMINQDGYVATPFGLRRYSNFVRNQKQQALKITTKCGYEITVSPDHKCEVWRDTGCDFTSGHQMVKASDFQRGDYVRFRLGVTAEPIGLAGLPPMPLGDVRAKVFRTPAVVTEDIAEFFGLMVADGTVFKSGFRLVKQHADVVDRFRELGHSIFGIEGHECNNTGTGGWEFSSTILSDWLLQVGGMSPGEKAVPIPILKSSSKIHAAFLRGLFEDGTVNLKGDRVDHVEWSSCYPDMVRTVRTMLLRLGLISGTTKKQRDRLYIYGAHAIKFGQVIGFISNFKQSRLSLPTSKQVRYRIPVLKKDVPKWHSIEGFSEFDYQNARAMKFVSREVAGRLAVAGINWATEGLNWHYDTIATIEETECETMCIEVPDGHRFLQNGLPWGNSQGSQWPVVVVIADDSSGAGRVTSFEWHRTAWSRAQKLCFTIGKLATIHRQCRKSALRERKTFLVELLKEVA